MNKLFRISIIFFISLLLGGCTMYELAYDFKKPSVTYGFPPIDMVQVGKEGAYLVASGNNVNAYDLLKLNDNLTFSSLIGKQAITSGYFVKFGEDETYEFFAPTTLKSPPGDMYVKSGFVTPLYALCLHKEGNYFAGYQEIKMITPSTSWGSYRREMFYELDDSNVEEAIKYTGKHGGILSFVYISNILGSETKSEVFTFKYPEDKIINIAGCILEIIKTDDKEIVYRVQSDFPSSRN